MKTASITINLPLNFNQVVEMIRQLPFDEKKRLTEVLKKETKRKPEVDKIITHFASEKALAKDWLSP
jgi:hypothetical protein